MESPPTFDDLFSLACGEIGLRKDDFLSLTPSEFFLIVRGYNKRMEDEQMMLLYNTRTIAYHCVAPHVKDLPSIEKFMPLPTDNIKSQAKAKTHEWAELPEEELQKRFGD